MDSKELDEYQKEIEKELSKYWEYKGNEQPTERFCWIGVKLIQALRKERKETKQLSDIFYHDQKRLVKAYEDKKVLMRVVESYAEKSNWTSLTMNGENMSYLSLTKSFGAQANKCGSEAARAILDKVKE